ncbi:hypothetical protein RCL1_004750 [Eukaryota sp. TZLM3-RCL]
MGFWPSKLEYEHHKFLWYVGFSRAIDKIHVLNLDSLLLNPLLQLVENQQCYQLHFLPSYPSSLTFAPNRSRSSLAVTDLFDENFMDEQDFFELESILPDSFPDLKSNVELDIFKFQEKARLYGIVVESLLTFLYHARFKTLLFYLKQMLNRHESLMHVTKTNARCVKYLESFYRIKNPLTEVICVFRLKSDSFRFPEHVKEFVEKVLKSRKGNSPVLGFLLDNKQLYLAEKLQDRQAMIEQLFSLCATIESCFPDENCSFNETVFDVSLKRELLTILWKISLINDHFETEDVTAVSADVSPYAESLLFVFDQVLRQMLLLPSGVEFQVGKEFRQFPFVGVFDAFHAASNTIYEFKFSQHHNRKHECQVLLYREILRSDQYTPSIGPMYINVILVNLYQETTRWLCSEVCCPIFKLLQFLAHCCRKKQQDLGIRNLVFFYDLINIDNNYYCCILEPFVGFKEVKKRIDHDTLLSFFSEVFNLSSNPVFVGFKHNNILLAGWLGIRSLKVIHFDDTRDFALNILLENFDVTSDPVVNVEEMIDISLLDLKLNRQHLDSFVQLLNVKKKSCNE